MKPILILMSHGYYSLEMKNSAEMIVGPIEGLYTVSMTESDGLEGTKAKLRAVLEETSGSPVVIAADMMAGTPSNVAVMEMLQNENIRVIAGMNLPMAIEYAVSDEEDLDAMAQFLKDVALEAVKLLEIPELDDGEEGFEN